MLNKKRARSKKLARELSQDNISAEVNKAWQDEQKLLSSEIRTLEAARDVFSKQILGLNADISKVSAKLEMFTKDRRIGEESVYTDIDRIFQSYGANRSYYFGRQFQGKDICKIMDKADELFGTVDTSGGKIRAAFISHVTAKDLGDAAKEELLDKVNKMCDDVGIGMKLWDGALAAIHVNDYDSDHCQTTQDRIDKAMAHTRGMGISITPKMHGMEIHVVNQMQDIPGGIGRMMEHWIEQYHQTGYRFDVAYSRTGSTERAANVRARLERMTSNHEVKMNRQHLEVKYVGSRKRKAVALKEEYNVKQEKRDKALADMYASLGTKNDESEIIEEKLKELYDVDDAEEINELGMQLLGDVCVYPPH